MVARVLDPVMLVGVILTTAGCAAFQPVAPDFNTTHYIVTVDPNGRAPPSAYRMQVSGMSGWPFGVNFATAYVDTRALRAMQCKANPSIDQAEDSAPWPSLTTMFLFGPEGMRQVPRNHDFVVVIGDPIRFFETADIFLENVRRLPIPGGSPDLSSDQERARDLRRHLVSLLERRGP